MPRSIRRRTRSRLPTPESVVLEFTLPPPPQVMPTAAARRRVAARTVYRVLRTNQVDEYESPLSVEAAVAAARPRRAPGDSFSGKARRAAKISIADAATEEFTDLSDLVDSLPDEDEMVDHDPPITTKRSSNRVAEER